MYRKTACREPILTIRRNMDKVCSVLGSEGCDRDKEHYIITRVEFGDNVLYSLFRKYRSVGIINEPEDCVH